MSVITFRFDDKKKKQAELIAESIGLPLSSVLNVLLNRFIVEKGFPFSVNAPDVSFPVFDSNDLEKSVAAAITERDSESQRPRSAYIDLEGVYHPSETR